MPVLSVAHLVEEHADPEDLHAKSKRFVQAQTTPACSGLGIHYTSCKRGQLRHTYAQNCITLSRKPENIEAEFCLQKKLFQQWLRHNQSH